MRTVERVLSAGVPDRFSGFARYFRLMETQSGPVDIDLMHESRVVYQATGVDAGFYAIPDGGFDEVQITSSVSQTIKIATTLGGGGYDRAAGSVSITSIANRVSVANTQKTVTTASAQLLAANLTRRYLLVQNKDAAGGIWINFGAGAATQANGVRIGPGQTFAMEAILSSDAVQAIGDVASNVNVVVVEG